MKEIYQHASLCIAATAAHNGNAGLFHDRDPRGVYPIKVDLSWSPTVSPQLLSELPPAGRYWLEMQCLSTKAQIDDAPLNSRAWVSCLCIQPGVW
jgi:hypothetical protein